MNVRRRIFIDPGHGGSDPGAIGNGMRESDINLEVALALRPLLEWEGFEVLLSRAADVFLDINNRWQTANNWGADLFISTHTNAGGGAGIEVLIPTASPNNPSRDLNANRRLAQDVANSLATSFGMRLRRNNGVMLETETRHGSIGVLRNTRMLAIMPELAFIDSPLSNPDVGVLRNRRQELATALTKGVFNFLGIDPRQNTNTSTKENIMQEKRYNTIDEVPDRARPTIQKLIDKGALAGRGGELKDLSTDMLRIFVIHDRMGGLFIKGKSLSLKTIIHKGNIFHLMNKSPQKFTNLTPSDCCIFSPINAINALCSSENLKITFTYLRCFFLLPQGLFSLSTIIPSTKSTNKSRVTSSTVSYFLKRSTYSLVIA